MSKEKHVYSGYSEVVLYLHTTYANLTKCTWQQENRQINNLNDSTHHFSQKVHPE